MGKQAREEDAICRFGDAGRKERGFSNGIVYNGIVHENSSTLPNDAGLSGYLDGIAVTYPLSLDLERYSFASRLPGFRYSQACTFISALRYILEQGIMYLMSGKASKNLCCYLVFSCTPLTPLRPAWDI